MKEIEKNTVTLTGDDALRAKYLIALARVEYPKFYELTDSEILEALIDMASAKEVAE